MNTQLNRTPDWSMRMIGGICWCRNLVVVALFAMILSCADESEYIPVAFPGAAWEIRKPEELGVNTKKMQEALDYLASESGEDGLEEVFIVKRGYVIYQGDSVSKKHNIYSSSKSFTSTVMGVLGDFDKAHTYTKAADIDPDLLELYPEVRLRHFASMTSGYSGKGGSRWNEPSQDWSLTPYKIDTPLFEPGTEYAYWDEAQMMFGRLLTKTAQKTLKEVFDEHIGNAIGMGEYQWITEGAVDSIPINNGCTGVLINAEQLARFGHLYLNEGHWNGKQLLSRYWIKRATTNQVNAEVVADTDRKKVDGRGCYGYNWWVNGLMPTGKFHMPDAPKSLYYASGLHNNMCFVIPEWDMVVVRRGEDGNPAKGKPFVYNEFFKRLALAIEN